MSFRQNQFFFFLLYGFLFSTFLTSCGLFQRTNQSGYAFQTPDYSTSFEYDQQQRQLLKTQMELGYSPDEKLSYSDMERVRNRYFLETKIKSLEPSEYNQYIKYSHAMKNDKEKLYFLNLQPEEREDWAKKHHLNTPLKRASAVTRQLIKEADIGLGMHKEAVLASWGPPNDVKIAGNKKLQNEMWVYRKSFVKNDGFVNQTRHIYFESGRVVGWETNQ